MRRQNKKVRVTKSRSFMLRAITALGVLLAGLGISGAAKAAAPFDAGRAGFSVEANGLAIDYRTFAFSVLPGQAVSLKASRPAILKGLGAEKETARSTWVWSAPETPGVYPVELAAGDDAITLNVIVLEPAIPGADDIIDGYKLGSYPSVPFRGLDSYRAPEGYIVVTKENAKMPVSPHFVLEQFLCKQEGGWPKLAVLRPQLLVKLERILEKVNEAGIRTDGFVVMSGYRTPWYNRAIGNTTTSSRHLYGGAADIFIDVNPRDGVMDDLNGDGVTSKKDADFLYDLLQSWSSAPELKDLPGGLGSYKETHAHGPFVHVDERGYPARWGR
jgi:hypothetical protein